jgi:exodeoxyribonuclease-3
MKIVTWNVNSIRAREERLLAFLARASPDIVCLQELKVADDAFPIEAVRAAGYEAAVFGQRTYNGVAVLSRNPITEIERNFQDGVDDPQARLVSVVTHGIRVVSAYCPNGGEPTSDKFAYKLEWFERLKRWLAPRIAGPGALPLALCGDYNVAPDDLDVKNPLVWANTVLCHPRARAALADVASLGLVDTFRKHHPEGQVFSWWDYRMLGFPKNDGLRIDHIFATPALAERSFAAGVDREERKGKSASDHAPVWVDFAEA